MERSALAAAARAGLRRPALPMASRRPWLPAPLSLASRCYRASRAEPRSAERGAPARRRLCAGAALPRAVAPWDLSPAPTKGGGPRPASCEKCEEGPVSSACLVDVVPFDYIFLDALGLRRISDSEELSRAAVRAFDSLDVRGEGSIGQEELKALLRERIYRYCPPGVWAGAPDELLARLGGGGELQGRVTRAEWSAAVERIADTVDSRVWPLATSQFFSALMFAVQQPLMPLLVKELGISMAHFGGMVALMPIMRVAMTFPSTTLSNRYGRRPLTVQGQLIAALGMGGSALITGSWHMALSRLVISVGTTFATVGQQNMLSDIATGRTRSRVFAPGAMRAGAAFAVGPALGGLLISMVGPQATFVLVGLGMAAVSLRNRLILTETLQPALRPPQDPALPQPAGRGWSVVLREMLRDPTSLAVMSSNAAFNFTSISARFVLLPMLALDTWGLGATGLGLALGGMSLVQVAVSKPASHVADVYGRKVALLPGLGLTAASMAAAAYIDGSPLGIALVCSGWAAGTSLVGSVPNALALDTAGRLGFDQKETAQALAIARAAGDFGMAFGALAQGSLLAALGAPTAFASQAGILASVTAAAAFVFRKL